MALKPGSTILDLVEATDPPQHPAPPFLSFSPSLYNEQGWGGDVRASSSTIIQYISRLISFQLISIQPNLLYFNSIISI